MGHAMRRSSMGRQLQRISGWGSDSNVHGVRRTSKEFDQTFAEWAKKG